MSDKHVHPAALFAHQPATPGGSSHQAAQTGWEIRDILVRQSHREPRSVQRAPGPSELGMVCLQGETEVVTRQGIREIRDLAKEGSAELLIPMLYEGSDVRKKWGRFTEVPVESFGEQELYEITLHRGQDSKTIFATADHHWFRSYWSGKQRAQKRLATTDLRPGYRLTQLRRAMPRSTTMMPVAVAQGFTFGDGPRAVMMTSTARPSWTCSIMGRPRPCYRSSRVSTRCTGRPIAFTRTPGSGACHVSGNSFRP